jgi:hypothetical protein
MPSSATTAGHQCPVLLFRTAMIGFKRYGRRVTLLFKFVTSFCAISGNIRLTTIGVFRLLKTIFLFDYKRLEKTKLFCKLESAIGIDIEI